MFPRHEEKALYQKQGLSKVGKFFFDISLFRHLFQRQFMVRYLLLLLPIDARVGHECAI